MRLRTFPYRDYKAAARSAEAKGTPPIYDIIRHGHEWYEYPDIHGPKGTFSKSLTEKTDQRMKK